MGGSPGRGRNLGRPTWGRTSGLSELAHPGRQVVQTRGLYPRKGTVGTDLRSVPTKVTHATAIPVTDPVRPVFAASVTVSDSPSPGVWNVTLNARRPRCNPVNAAG